MRLVIKNKKKWRDKEDNSIVKLPEVCSKREKVETEKLKF